MAGTLNIALAQQFDSSGDPLAGALLYFFQSGTVATPQNAYQDYNLTIQLPNPVVADQSGRIPMFYLADGPVHVRLTDSSGVVIFDYPVMQVVGPSSGSGGGGTVDPSTVLSTGDVKFRATSETLTGWVKANAQTIGSATSGATQRANADTQNLFVYLWTNFTDAHCPVSGGRGSTALSDFQANKTIQLPDWRATALVGLDDMGNSASGIIQASNVTSGNGDGPTTPGASGGESNHTLSVNEMPSHSHSVNDNGHDHSTPFETTNQPSAGGSGPLITSSISPGTNTGTSYTGVSLQNTGGGASHNNMQTFVLGTWYLKL